MRPLLIGACVVLMAGWSLETSAQKTLRGKVFAPEDHSGHNHAPGAHVGKETFDPLPGATVVTWTEFDDSPFYCVEPWMGPPNSPEHKKGLHWVEPGETESFNVKVSLEE